MSTDILTTIDVGKIMGVHHTTVARWIDKGRVKAIITPGGHRRIKRKDLIEYFRTNNLPVPEDLLVRGRDPRKKAENLKILIVEDDTEVLDVLAFGLRKHENSYSVETAADGFQAGQIIERFQPDLVVLDIFLPTIDGYKVCRIIKEHYPDIKVIAITGRGSETVRKQILDEGADEYLEKPFDLSDLAESINNLLIVNTAEKC